MDETWDAFLAALTPATADLVRTADALVRGLDPDVVRVVWPHQRTVGYGVGPRKNSEHYAYLDVYDRHLNLGLNRGAALAEAGLDGGLLEGTGRSFRKVAVRGADVLADPRLPALLRAARAERLAALGRT
ncbi:hypothetical protein LY71_10882 [Geodermatophilus tzadiensis]|uniref:YdhG-like domain-containing protein n=1 Tax=Geodermatophilus tzadiensis TaxID=1137988 RepID=A0A2T0TSN9_9ACTN|nr:hypothetical protein [Geodermatophilus tzadiensis]PRY48704.1 hypothetical protein LY71_10882 [Geodermatophilus tzadiensis]